MGHNWPVKKLGEIADFLDNLRKPVTASDRVSGPYPYYGANGQQDSVNSYIFDDELVLLAEDGGYFGSKTRPVAYRVSGKCWVNNHAHVLKNKDGISDIDFLGYSLMYYDVTPYISGTTRAKLNKSEAMRIPLKVPLLPIQKKIVERLDVIRKAQELCDQQIQKTKELCESILIEIEKIKGSKVKISQICLVKGGKRIPKGLTFSSKKTNRPYLRVADFKNNSININELKFIDDLVFEKISNYTISKEDVYISIAGTTGLIGLIPNSLDGASLTENAAKLIIKNKKVISKEYLMYCLLIPSNQSSFRASTHSTSVGKLALFRIQNTNINLPTFEEQQKIVEKLEAVQNYKKLLQKEKELLKELFDSVLDKSMKGEMDLKNETL